MKTKYVCYGLISPYAKFHNSQILKFCRLGEMEKRRAFYFFVIFFRLADERGSLLLEHNWKKISTIFSNKNVSVTSILYVWEGLGVWKFGVFFQFPLLIFSETQHQCLFKMTFHYINCIKTCRRKQVSNFYNNYYLQKPRVYKFFKPNLTLNFQKRAIRHTLK